MEFSCLYSSISVKEYAFQLGKFNLNAYIFEIIRIQRGKIVIIKLPRNIEYEILEGKKFLV